MVLTLAGDVKHCFTVPAIHAVRILRATGASICNKNYRYFDYMWVSNSFDMGAIEEQYKQNTPLVFTDAGTRFAFHYDSIKRPLVRPKPKKEPAGAKRMRLWHR